MRNLLLIHLESLNYINYRSNRALFPCLTEWEKKSLSFSKYFSTATSTLMVLSDLAYGGMLQNEPCENLTDSLGKYCYEDSFLDKLQKKGYKVRAVSYPENETGDVIGCNERYFIGYDIEMEEMTSYESYMQAIGNVITEKIPFVIWACCYAGNISYNRKIQNMEKLTGLECWEAGYRQIDYYVNSLMNMLRQKNVLNNTTVIFYGDHGDDLFTHGKHQGLMHAIEPFEALIHTPFWIYDTRFAPEDIDSLIDTTDIRKIIERLLELPEEKLGVSDLGPFFRTYSLARNVYAAQKVREASFHKAYSLTDGTFLFLAGNQGMELYHIGMDAACQHNLLDYFDFDKDVLSVNQTAYGRMKFHFPYVIDESALLQIQHVFYEYKDKLTEKVKELYEYAECSDLFLEVDFCKIHYGWEEEQRRMGCAYAKNVQFEDMGEFDVYERYLKGKRIVLYGAGNYGKYFYGKMKECADIVAWVDENYRQIPQVSDRVIQSPDSIKDLNFDVVFIAVISNRVKKKIKGQLIQMGVPQKMIF